MKIGDLIIAALCIAAIVLRNFVPHVTPSLPGTYEAMAHILCGVLIGLFIAGRCALWVLARRRSFLAYLLIITVVEAVFFFATK